MRLAAHVATKVGCGANGMILIILDATSVSPPFGGLCVCLIYNMLDGR